MDPKLNVPATLDNTIKMPMSVKFVIINLQVDVRPVDTVNVMKDISLLSMNVLTVRT
jgi:hypothetical protein